MSTVKRVKQCAGCGAILQADDPNLEGYVHEEVLNKTDNRVLFCNECYENFKNNYVAQEPTLNSEFLTLLDDAIRKQALIVYVVDLFSFEASFIRQIDEHLAPLDVIMVGNKIDVLPPKTNYEEIREYLRHRARMASLNVKDIVLVDIHKKETIDKMFSVINENRHGKDVYVIGAKSSGKTTLINAFLKNFKNDTKQLIATTNYPGTHLHTFKIPLDDNSSIYEPTGFNIDNSIMSKVETHVQRFISPRRPVSANKMTLHPGQSIFIAGLARVDLIDGPKTEVKLYVSDEVECKKKSSSDIDKKFIRYIHEEKLFPVSDRLRSIADFDVYDVDVDEKGKRDIGILGLGWIAFEGNGQKLRFLVPKKVSIYSSRSKIK